MNPVITVWLTDDLFWYPLHLTDFKLGGCVAGEPKKSRVQAFIWNCTCSNVTDNVKTVNVAHTDNNNKLFKFIYIKTKSSVTV